MESYDILRQTLRKTSPKAVASDLGVSLSLVYKWAEKPSTDQPGTKNPLDRVLQIIELSEDDSIIHWLCQKHGGSFVKNPSTKEDPAAQLLPATHNMIGKFSHLLNEISQAASDSYVSNEEAKEIRQTWDQLKSCAESFVRSCENGTFQKP